MRKKTYLLINLLSLALILSVVVPAAGQNYEAIGLRGGLSGGITYKAFVSDEIGFELVAGFRDRGIQVTGLYEYHEPASLLYRDQFLVYYGFGGHLGYYNDFEKITIGSSVLTDWRTYPSLGVDGMLGIEYQMEAFPFVIGIDYKPFIDLFGPYRKVFRNLTDIGLNFRYIF